MKFIEFIGFLAGTLTTVSFLPQVIRVWKTRSTKDLSITMFALFSIGVTLWMIYGIMLHQLPIVIPNAVTLVLASIILAFKFIYK